MKIDTSIPINFEIIEEKADSRFAKGKIWICHVGQNLNNSSLSKNVITKAIPSLSNVPVLGFIQVGNDNQTDFAGHEQRIIIDDQGARFEYMGRVYGVVPESNNAKFEFKVCEDNVEREFLTAEVLLYTKFQESIDIVAREGIHSQSMELDPTSIKGKFNKQGLFEFEEFKFEGLCLLGEDVPPAMTGSVLELFDRQDFSASMKDMLQEFNQYYSAQTEEGGKLVNEKLELFKKYPELTEEDVADLKAKLDDYSLEEVDAELQKLVQEKNNDPENVEPEGTVEPQPEPVEPPAEPENPTPTEPEPETQEPDPQPEPDPEKPVEPENQQFSTTNGQMTQNIALALGKISSYQDSWGDTMPRYYYMDHDDNRVYASDAQDNWLPVGMYYTVNGDSITIDSGTARRIKFVPQDLEEGQNAFAVISADLLNSNINKSKEKFESESQSKFSSMENSLKEEKQEIQNKLDEVTALYNQKLQDEKQVELDKLFSQFEGMITEDEASEIRALYPDKSMEDLEVHLYALVGKKQAKFSANKKNNPTPHIDLGNPDANKHPLDGKTYKELF